jgi:deazaflavin-dependent oxidoreductase (nitroreductase family)
MTKERAQMGTNDEAEDWYAADLRIRAEIRELGEVRTGHFAGRQVLLLTSTGAKSGEARTSVLSYSTTGYRYVIIASKAGGPENPAWYRNLKADPSAVVEVGGERLEVRATEAGDAERAERYAAHAELHQGFAAYQGMTERTIPVILLEHLD